MPVRTLKLCFKKHWSSINSTVFKHHIEKELFYDILQSAKIEIYFL